MMTPDIFIMHPLLPFMRLLLSACSSDSDSSSGGCDLIANPDGPAFFKVENNITSGLEWYFQSGYAFGADMKPGECTNMGVASSQYTVHFQPCNIGADSCTSNFGVARSIVFSVIGGETYTVTVDNNFFN
ncbi:MAG: hypothetical protein ISR73_01040 [Gammaproteobacteria bacterium]|nr:hypothetical protein [Gammaproteobacteria bacterium]